MANKFDPETGEIIKSDSTKSEKFWDKRGEWNLDKPLMRFKGGRTVLAIDHDIGRITFREDPENIFYTMGEDWVDPHKARFKNLKPGDVIDPGYLFNTIYDIQSIDPDTVNWRHTENKIINWLKEQ